MQDTRETQTRPAPADTTPEGAGAGRSGFCCCVEAANEALGRQYPGVKVMSGFGELGRVAVATFRESGRGRMPTLFASYCPFCGIRYGE